MTQLFDEDPGVDELIGNVQIDYIDFIERPNELVVQEFLVQDSKHRNKSNLGNLSIGFKFVPDQN